MSFLDRIKNLFRSPFEQATTAAINAGNVWAATAAVQQTIPFQDAQQQVYNDTWVNQALNAVDNTLLAISPQLELEFQTPQEAYQIQPLERQMQLPYHKMLHYRQQMLLTIHKTMIILICKIDESNFDNRYDEIDF